MLHYSRGPVDFAGRITPQSIDANQRVNLWLGDEVMHAFYHAAPTVCLPVFRLCDAWDSARHLWLHGTVPARVAAHWWSCGR